MGVFCDLTQAFDRVDHDILPDKLESCGVRSLPLSWLRSADRKKFVEVGAVVRSSMAKSIWEVPQGSILGPLLFINYFNDVIPYLSLSRLTI